MVVKTVAETPKQMRIEVISGILRLFSAGFKDRFERKA
jgi:hypothetical protein